MKLLPRKQDIDKEKNLERKKEIDSGVALATSIDRLRETKVNEERQLQEWRDASIRLAQKEIDDYLEVKENLRKQTEEAEIYRKKLIEPLDQEWENINLEKMEIANDKESIYRSNKSLKLKSESLEKKWEEVSETAIRTSKNEEDSKKDRSETIALKELAQSEYEIAREEREDQNNQYDKKMSEVIETKREYEVALSLVEIRENEVKEEKADLINRENHLESKEKRLKIIWDEIQRKQS